MAILSYSFSSKPQCGQKLPQEHSPATPVEKYKGSVLGRTHAKESFTSILFIRAIKPRPPEPLPLKLHARSLWFFICFRRPYAPCLYISPPHSLSIIVLGKTFAHTAPWQAGYQFSYFGGMMEEDICLHCSLAGYTGSRPPEAYYKKSPVGNTGRE